MDLSALFPPSDLLEKVRGVESGLRQRKKIAGAGAVTSIVSITVSAFYLLAIAEEQIKNARELLEKTLNDPVLLLLALVFFLSLAVTWSRYWLRESRQPFRYTCSIGSFDAVEAGTETTKKLEPWMLWMPHDMTCLLNERVQRFFFAGEAGDAGTEPYIHVRAHWVVRKSANGAADEIEIMPRVRLGPPNTPEVMAASAVFLLPPPVNRGTYEQLLEQVYHSVVTEVYRQLKGDVETKVQLLPTKRHRATALLFEADDYAKSNSLHAYAEAAKLYRMTAELCDPELRPLPETPTPRMLRTLRIAIHRAGVVIRRFGSQVRPSAAEIDLIGARATSGYARMLVFTRILRTLSGQTAHAAFEATPMARRATEMIASLSRDIPRHTEAMFEAQVTRVLAEWNVGNPAKAGEALEAARSLDPQRADEDTVFLLGSALLSPDTRTRLGLYKRAVECAPRSEVAQYCLASEGERVWRLREPLEQTVAEIVLAEYATLRTLNPGNLTAYANAAHIHWLLGQCDQARTLFEQGRRFKSTRRELSVAELDYGLARIEAERGNLDIAYQHYLDAVSSLPNGIEDDFRSYFFQNLTPAIMKRFRAYRRTVRKHIAKIPSDAQEQIRIGKSIHAFILNDMGEAYLHAAGIQSSYLFDNPRQKAGTWALKAAIVVNPNFLLPYATLARVLDDEPAIGLLRKGLTIDPSWSLGKALLAHRLASTIPDVRKLAAELQALRDERQGLNRASLSYAELRRRDQLDEDIPKREAELAAAPHTVIARREEALGLVREQLPQAWLWDGTSLRLDALTNRAYERTFRWERELLTSHVVALAMWARCYAMDDERLPDAICVFKHVRSRFWPTSYAAELATARLRGTTGESLRAIIVEEELKSNPLVAVELAGFDVVMTREQFCAADRETCRWYGDYRDLRGTKERRAYAYQQVARHAPGTEDATALYSAAAELSSRGQACSALAVHLAERAAAATGDVAAALLNRAVAEAEQAVKRDPHDETYRQQLTTLKWTRQFGSAAATLPKSPDPLSIHISTELAEEGNALLAATGNVRRKVLGAKHPWVRITDPLTNPREYQILIKGRVVAVDSVPEKQPIVEWVMQRFEAELQRNIGDLLHVADVVTILDSEQPGEGTRIRELMPELTAVLHQLAAERIPLPPLMPLVRAFQQVYDPAWTRTAVVEQVRVHPAVHKRIAALQARTDVAVVRIGPGFENAVRIGRAMTDRKITEGLRKSVADSFETAAATHRLLVCPPDLRPLIAKILDGAVERLTIASERQVAPRVLRSASTIADYVEITTEGAP